MNKHLKEDAIGDKQFDGLAVGSSDLTEIMVGACGVQKANDRDC